MKTVALKIKGMHCASCPIMIEGTIEDELIGVKSAKANYQKQECIVEYDEEQVELDRILDEVEKIGYKATVM